MTIFLTGGNGFIGSVVARSLAAAGHRLVCLLRDTSRVERLDGVPFTRARGDVRDRDSLRAGMAGTDATIHLAAPGAWEPEDPARLAAVVEGGTRNVLDVAADRPGHRVVVVSSAAAIAASRRPIVFDERTAFAVPDRTLHYAFAKHRAELAAHAAHARGVPVVIVNPAEVYGPGDTALVTAGSLIDFATSTPVFVCRGGTSVVHVDDVATGIVAALERGQPGERYILGGDNLEIRRMAELVLAWSGRRAPIVTLPGGALRLAARTAVALHVPLPFNPHVVPYATCYWFVDNAKARRELSVSFRGATETIGATLDWLEQTDRIPQRRPRKASASAKATADK